MTSLVLTLHCLKITINMKRNVDYGIISQLELYWKKKNGHN